MTNTLQAMLELSREAQMLSNDAFIEIAALRALVEKQDEMIANQKRMIEIQEQLLLKAGVSATRWGK